MKKHGPSLEEERQAVLERIHASRASYRRMLMEVDEIEEARVQHRVHNIAGNDPDFPRSMTMRWLVENPYLAVAAVAAVAVGAPLAVRALAKSRKAMARRRLIGGAPFSSSSASAPVYAAPPAPQQPAVSAGSAAVTGLMTIAAMILRDPARMQMIMRFASNTFASMRQRRTAS